MEVRWRLANNIIKGSDRSLKLYVLLRAKVFSSTLENNHNKKHQDLSTDKACWIYAQGMWNPFHRFNSKNLNNPSDFSRKAPVHLA